MRGCWLTVAPREGADWGDSWAPALPGCLRLWPGVIPCASQTLLQHTLACLVTSCVVAKPFPITQAHALLYPVCQLNPSPLSSCLFLVILTQHNMTRNTDISFPLPLIIVLYVCLHAEMCVCLCAPFLFFSAWWFGIFSVSTNSSSPDTSVSVSSVEAWGNEALCVYWSPYTPLCIRETLFSMPNRNTAPSILYTTPRHQLLFSHSSVPGGLW